MDGIRDSKITSYIMSTIKGKDTKPEILVRKFLFTNGFRYRLHDKKLPGKPDIVLPKYKTVILVNGCFWRGHEKNCNIYKVPKTRTEWWLAKIGHNKSKDRKTKQSLKKQGWKVITVWECQLHESKRLRMFNTLVDKILNSK